MDDDDLSDRKQTRGGREGGMGTMLTVPTEGDSECAVFPQRGTALTVLSEKGYALSSYREEAALMVRMGALHLLVLTGIDELH